jgi:hypothetical protein
VNARGGAAELHYRIGASVELKGREIRCAWSTRNGSLEAGRLGRAGGVRSVRPAPDSCLRCWNSCPWSRLASSARPGWDCAKSLKCVGSALYDWEPGKCTAYRHSVMPRSTIRDLDRLAREKDLPRPDSFVASAEAALPPDPTKVEVVEVKLVDGSIEVSAPSNGNGSTPEPRRRLRRRRSRRVQRAQ